MKILGTMFFLGEIDEVDFMWVEDKIGNEECLGATVEDECGTPCLVLIDIRDKSRQQGVRDLRSLVVGTLLHEMCHVVIGFYGCEGTCGEPECIAASLALSKISSGHHLQWLRLAVWVQTYARKFLKDLDIRLGIFDSVYAEYQRHKRLPSLTDWMTILKNLRPDEVDDLVGEEESLMVLDYAYMKSGGHQWKIMPLVEMLQLM